MKRTLTLILILVYITGCKKETVVNEARVTRTETDLAIMMFNTTNAATGFETVFSQMPADSAAMVHLAQDFVNPVRFLSDRTGYFFVESMNGWMLAHPLNPEWIGTCRYDIQDPTGKYYVRDMINAARYSGYGFVEYFMKDPSDGMLHQKRTFVSSVPSMAAYAGSGIYLNTAETYLTPLDAKKYMVEELTRSMACGIGGVLNGFYPDTLDQVAFCRNMIGHVRFFNDGSGYFFIYNLSCRNVAHGYQKDLEGRDLYNLQDSHGAYIIRDFSSLVQKQGSGFYQYWWPDPATNKDEPKLAYLTRIPGTSYFIGAGFYMGNN